MKNMMNIFYFALAIILIFPVSGFSNKKQLSSCRPCESLDGFVPPGQINDDIRKMTGKYKGIWPYLCK